MDTHPSPKRPRIATRCRDIVLGPSDRPRSPSNARRDPRSGALLNLEERVRLETMSLAVDPRRTLLVRRIDEAKHFAGRLVDPLMLVVDPVLALNFQVGLVSSDNVGRLDSRDVVHVHVCRHGAHTPPMAASSGAHPEIVYRTSRASATLTMS